MTLLVCTQYSGIRKKLAFFFDHQVGHLPPPSPEKHLNPISVPSLLEIEDLQKGVSGSFLLYLLQNKYPKAKFGLFLGGKGKGVGVADTGDGLRRHAFSIRESGRFARNCFTRNRFAKNNASGASRGSLHRAVGHNVKRLMLVLYRKGLENRKTEVTLPPHLPPPPRPLKHSMKAVLLKALTSFRSAY